MTGRAKLDVLNDMTGDADEDKSKDMLRVYGNVWRVVKATSASFWLRAIWAGIINRKGGQASFGINRTSRSISRNSILRAAGSC
jgi:hypothetical protein